jgi:hypothetical protein
MLTLTILSTIGNQDDQPRPLGLDDPAKAENDAPLIFVEDPQGGGKKNNDQDNGTDGG